MYDLLDGENIGAFLIGLAISLILFGVLILQGYTYYENFSNDSLLLKALAGTILLMETAHTLITAYMMYQYLVVLRGFIPYGPNSYTLATSLIPAAIIPALVQGFFAFRIYRLSGNLYIYALCWVLFLLRFVGSLALVAETYIDVPRVPNLVSILTKFKWLIALVFIIGAVADVIITVSLCYYLRRLAPHQQFTATSHILNRLLRWVIRTGMITSISSIIVVIVLYVKPFSAHWYGAYVITTKLYSNSFFVSLNMRRQLREERITEMDAIFQNKSATGRSSSD